MYDSLSSPIGTMPGTVVVNVVIAVDIARGLLLGV